MGNQELMIMQQNDKPDSQCLTQATPIDGTAPAMNRLTQAAKPGANEDLEAYYKESATPSQASHTFDIHLNPLLAAAAHLFPKLIEVKNAKDQAAVKLNDEMREAIKTFELRARQAGVEHHQVITARYVLCTVIDEAARAHAWGQQGDWSSRSLLSHFHRETSGGERVFSLVNRMISRPAHHLHMMELTYFCFALGFKGKYGVSGSDEAGELEATRDELYRQIRQLRGDTLRELSPHWQGLHRERLPPPRLTPKWLVALCTLISLTAMYSAFAWVLSEQRTAVLQPFQLPAPTTVEQPR